MMTRRWLMCFVVCLACLATGPAAAPAESTLALNPLSDLQLGGVAIFDAVIDPKHAQQAGGLDFIWVNVLAYQGERQTLVWARTGHYYDTIPLGLAGEVWQPAQDGHPAVVGPADGVAHLYYWGRDGKQHILDTVSFAIAG